MQVYKIILGITFYLIWLSLFAARFAQYDDNYFLTGFAFLISIAATVTIAVYGYFKKEIVKSTMNLTISFLATSSPVSLYLFIYSFEDVFGQFFNHPI